MVKCIRGIVVAAMLGCWVWGVPMSAGTAWAAALDTPTLKPVIFLPQWSPQAQFAGYFVAMAKARMQDIVRPPGNPVAMGTLAPSDFQFVAEKLWQSGMIQTIPGFQEFYDPAPSTP